MAVKRRTFLKAGAVGALAAASTFPKPALSQGRLRWKMVTCWPKNFPGLGMTANQIGDQITKMSDGRLEVKVYGAGELVPAFEVFDAVREGIAELSHGWDGYWINKHPGAAFYGGVPNGLGPHEQVAWIQHGGGQALWEEMYADFNIQPFVAGVNPPSMFGWYSHEIGSLDGLKALKIRMAGLPGEVLSRLGATSVNLPGGEIMSALQAGVVDAVEWGGAWMDLAFGFQKIAKLCYWPGIHEPGASNSMLANRESYESLPDDLKEIIKVASHNGVNRLYAESTHQNAVSYEVLQQKHGVQFKRLPDDVIEAFLKVSLEVIRETAEKDPHAMRIHENFMEFRRRATNIAPTVELGYLGARST
jgi:TRAP-type mannitol/chloroaromatic compound transport system substrate-binding protein